MMIENIININITTELFAVFFVLNNLRPNFTFKQ